MAETKNVKELWQGAFGCGCLAIIIGCFFPPMWPFLIIGTIIAFIYAIVKSPYIFFRNRKRAIEDKVIVEKFEKALLEQQDAFPEIVDDIQQNQKESSKD